MDLKKELLVKILEFLEKDIKGKPLYQWVLQGLLYSFVIWIPLSLWLGYQKYTDVKKLEKIRDKKLQILQTKNRQYQNYLSKLNDIKIAYKELKKYFKEEEIELLKRKLDDFLSKRRIFRIEKEKVIVQSLGYDNYNYPLKFSSFYKKWQSVSLPEIKFTSKAVQDFNSGVQTYYTKYLDLKEKPIIGDVNVSLNGNRIILTFEPKKNGLLKVKVVRLVGFISDIKKVPAYPAISFLRTREKLSEWSQLYLGWFLKLNSREEIK
ncbi:MAG: hypothetical protein DSZ30_00725 [Aquificaceae bacterium]|nr:MAG: hypothetical protein DSZ30_00725 [Aquificaceae bacterium]